MGVEEVNGAVGASRADRNPVRENAAPTVAPSALHTSSSPDSATVLVVEDEESVRRAIVRGLSIAGFRVLEADGGETALALIRAGVERIDLVLADVVMPGLSGPDVVRAALTECPHMRVLFMSGYPDKTVFQPGMVRPGAPFLHKPFSFQELVGAVRKVLGQD